MRNPPGFMLTTSLCALCVCGGIGAQAQTSPACPPAPNLVTVTVSPMVTFDPASSLFTYRYSISNDATSQQEVSDVALDFAPPASNVASPRGWLNTSFSGRSTLHWKAVEAAPLPAGQPDAGQAPPGLFQIKPGSSLGGFSFQSSLPPGPVNFYVLGFTDLPGADSEIDAETLADTCPEGTGGFFDLAVRGTTQGPVSFIPVQIDIKPGGSPNAINPRAQGVIPVAIVSTSTFDATTVDPASVRFGLAAAPARNGTGQVEDVNGDGLNDLVLHFDTQATGIACGDTSAALTGRTSSGVAIQGSDSIITVACKK